MSSNSARKENQLRKVLVRLLRQSPAMVVAMLALFVALTGTAVATTSALITGNQIKNSSITGADVKNKSLTARDFRGSVRGPRGLRGLTGAQGAQGLQGPQGPPGAPNPNATDSDKLDGLDSTAFLRAAQIVISHQRGWLAQNGQAGVVSTFSNLQTLGAGGRYYLPLVTPNSVGTQGYYLQKIIVCYNAANAGDLITTTAVTRSSVNNFTDETFSDPTDRTTVFPTTECYDLAVNDTAAPPGSVYNADLTVVGTVRIVRVTATYVAT
jgi:hypothetical protein